MPKSKYRKRDFQIYVTVRTRDPLANRSFIGPVAVRQNRRPGSPGYVWSLMADNFLVRHPDGSEAIYAAEELTLEPDAYWRVVHFEAGVLHGKELATHQEVVDHLNALKKGGVADAQVEGPFYEKKEVLVEGPIAAKTLFHHLTDDDV